MKIHHFVLLFIIFFLAAVIKTDISVGKLKSVQNEKNKISKSLGSATSDAINYLAASGVYGADAINKDEVVKTFFTSFYSAMGIVSDPAARTELEMYIPVILLCDSDGYYIYYYDSYTAGDGLTYSERRWTEKMPYYYQDDCFIYRFTLTQTVNIYDINNILNTAEKVLDINYHEFQVNDSFKDFRTQHSDSILLNDEKFELAKKGAIINQLENALIDYTSRHNEIARRNGITYSFAFPSGKEDEWAQYMDDVNLVVVFQGYPYGADRNYTFNKTASSGANILRKPVYYVEKKSWYYLAHKEGCPKLEGNINVLEETFDSIEECAKMGAYCDGCINKGTSAPEIK